MANQGIRKTETPQHEGQNVMLQKLLLIQKYNEDPQFERQPEWMRGWKVKCDTYLYFQCDIYFCI